MAKGRKTGGRVKGSLNKKTKVRSAEMTMALETLKKKIGNDFFEGDSVDLMTLIYKNHEFPMELRFEAAKAASKFERPVLAANTNINATQVTYAVALPDGRITSMDDWEKNVSPQLAIPKPRDTVN